MYFLRKKKIRPNTPFVNYKFVSSEMILKKVEYKSHFITIGHKRVTCRIVRVQFSLLSQRVQTGRFLWRQRMFVVRVMCEGGSRGGVSVTVRQSPNRHVLPQHYRHVNNGQVRNFHCYVLLFLRGRRKDWYYRTTCQAF